MFDGFLQAANGQHRWKRTVGIGFTLLTLTLVLWRIRRLEDHPDTEHAAVEAERLRTQPQTYERAELPGMSIEAPGIATIVGSYATGSLQADSHRVGATARMVRLEVVWAPGAAERENRLGRLLESWRAKRLSPTILERRAVKVGGMDGEQILIVVTGVGVLTEVTLTFTECGGRWVLISVSGDRGARAMSDRMTASFACTPDVTQDLYRSEVAFGDAPGWTREQLTGPVVLVKQNVRILPSIVLDDGTGPVADAIMRSFSGGQVALPRPPQILGEKLYWTGTFIDVAEATSMPVAVIAWRCADLRIAKVVVGGPSEDLQEGVELAMTGRCLRPDETAPSYPVSDATKGTTAPDASHQGEGG